MSAVMREDFPAAVNEAPEVSEEFRRLQEILAEKQNVAEMLEENDLKTIGMRCVSEYEADLESRSEWEEQLKDAIKLAKQVREDKNYPWAGAANVKYPLLAEAAVSFAARAYPELVPAKPVKAEVIGADPDGAKANKAARVSDFMSYQVLTEMDYWEEETDLLLCQLPILGNAFRKTYQGSLGVESRFISALDLVVNHNAKSLANCRRESEKLEFYANDVKERQRLGVWRDVKLTPDTREGEPDEDKPYDFIEQHRWLDLDDDGYEEPYVVTVHIATSTVMRIFPRFTPDDVILNGKNEVVRIEAERFYTHYQFFPNPDGGLYGWGLGNLLYPLNESINTVLNQLLDAGTLANLQGGFIAKGIRVKGGNFRLSPGEWKQIDSTGMEMKDSIVPIPAKEPSVVLFQLLGFLVDAGKSLANLKDVLAGEMPNANVPATTVLAMIEQGQKVFNSIYKRIYRALKQEFKKIYKLDGESLTDEEYQRVLDDPQATMQDFDQESYDICPAADPAASSQAQRLVRAQALMPMAQVPGFNAEAIYTEMLQAMGVDDPKRFYDPQKADAQKLAQMQTQMEAMERELAVKEADALAKAQKTQAEIKKIHADALKSLAETEAVEEGTQMGQYRMQLDRIAAELGVLANGATDPRGMGVLEGPPGNGMVPQQVGGGNAGPAGLAGPGPVPAPAL